MHRSRERRGVDDDGCGDAELSGRRDVAWLIVDEEHAGVLCGVPHGAEGGGVRFGMPDCVGNEHLFEVFGDTESFESVG